MLNCIILLARVKLVSCTATHFLVALLMVFGASGDRGPSVQPYVGVESSCGVVNAITLLLRGEGESAVVTLTSISSVIVTPVKVCELALNIRADVSEYSVHFR